MCVCVRVCDYSPFFSHLFWRLNPAGCKKKKRGAPFRCYPLVKFSLFPSSLVFIRFVSALFFFFFFFFFLSNAGYLLCIRRGGQTGSTQRVLLLARRQIGSLSSTARPLRNYCAYKSSLFSSSGDRGGRRIQQQQQIFFVSLSSMFIRLIYRRKARVNYSTSLKHFNSDLLE